MSKTTKYILIVVAILLIWYWYKKQPSQAAQKDTEADPGTVDPGHDRMPPTTEKKRVGGSLDTDEEVTEARKKQSNPNNSAQEAATQEQQIRREMDSILQSEYSKDLVQRKAAITGRNFSEQLRLEAIWRINNDFVLDD